MDYRNAYYHLFNRLTELTALLEAPEDTSEPENRRPPVDVPAYLRQLQQECEEICANDLHRIAKAPRRGGSGVLPGG